MVIGTNHCNATVKLADPLGDCSPKKGTEVGFNFYRSTTLFIIPDVGIFPHWIFPRRWEFDETWGYMHGEVVGETGYVCNWHDVEPGTFDMPTCVKGVCGGHNEYDVLPFKVQVC